MPWYPEMRQELLCTVSKLADPEYQQKVWVRGERSPRRVDCFDQVVHFIYDDTCLGENASEGIGFYVRDEAEAARIKRVVETLDHLFAVLGKELSDAEYLASAQWPPVVQAARELCSVLEDVPETYPPFPVGLKRSSK